MGIPPLDVSRFEGIPPDVKQGIPLVILRGYPSNEQERDSRLETARAALRGAEMKKTAKKRVLKKTEITITVIGPKKFRQQVVDEVYQLLMDGIFDESSVGCGVNFDSALPPTATLEGWG